MTTTVHHVVTRQHVAIIDVLDDAGRTHRITHLWQDGWNADAQRAGSARTSNVPGNWCRA